MHSPSRKFNKQKAFGQHFLKDASIIDEITNAAIDSLSRYPNASLLEIGPGKGALTLPLFNKLKPETRLIIAERDRDLIEEWKRAGRINQLLEGDFLDHSHEVLHGLGQCVVVSNLPYSAGTAIVVKLVEAGNQFPEMTLMFQAEVAKRLYAEPSTPDRGSLSLYIQNYFDVKKLLVAKPGAFNPPPKVMSEVVKLTYRKDPHVLTDTDEKKKAWDELLKTAFAHRRKMLRGNLSSSSWKTAFDQSGVDPTRRAESLTWEEWKAVWNARF